MKYSFIPIAIAFGTIGLGMGLGKLMDNYVNDQTQTPHQRYCEQLKVWHPDCKVE